MNTKEAIEGLRNVMRLKHFSLSTERTYCGWLVNAGASVRDVQSAMGHANLETTMGYITPDAQRVRSPLELLVQH